ncbi:MAG: sugar transferase, partial [Clostridia bacterium]
VGNVLRKCKIDELPQLLNVFGGKMSLVGPRPLTYSSYEQHTDYQKQQYLIKPGITGPASLEFSDEESIIASFPEEDCEVIYMREIVPRKTKLNLDYITKMNVFYDIKLIFKTFFAVIRKR